MLLVHTPPHTCIFHNPLNCLCNMYNTAPYTDTIYPEKQGKPRFTKTGAKTLHLSCVILFGQCHTGKRH